MHWYAVSFLGWMVTTIHSALTVFVLHGLWSLDPSTPEIEFFYGTAPVYVLLIVILLYARFKKVAIFKAKRRG